jgi:hypothetical protein
MDRKGQGGKREALDHMDGMQRSDAHVKEHDSEGPYVRGGRQIGRGNVISAFWRMTRGVSWIRRNET